jgi:hypothetical protein
MFLKTTKKIYTTMEMKRKVYGKARTTNVNKGLSHLKPTKSLDISYG